MADAIARPPEHSDPVYVAGGIDRWKAARGITEPPPEPSASPDTESL